jgi:archaellum component FlaC
MGMDALWNVGLTAGFGFLIWWIKAHHEELKRVTILLNRTREELAKEYVTKTDSNQVLGQIMSKFDRIEEKLDRLVERK